MDTRSNATVLPFNFARALQRITEMGKTPSFFYKGGINSISEASWTRIKRTGLISLRNIKKLALLLDVPAEELLLVLQNQPRQPRRITIVFMEDLPLLDRISLSWKILVKKFGTTPSTK